MNFLDLPNVMLIEIMEYLPYDEVSKKRLVCRRMDEICQQVLNCGFNRVIRQHAVNFKRIKALLPRRESERRNHCLARHADILTSIETRISMLSMTYTKYIDLNLCCFIPGRVLDEIYRILRLIAKTNRPLRPHEVLQELRDISSMAIEHFDEKIAASLKKNYVHTYLNACSDSLRSSSSSSSFPSLTFGTSVSTSSSSSSWNPMSSTLPSIPGTSSSVCCDGIRQRLNMMVYGKSSLLETFKKPLSTSLSSASSSIKCNGGGVHEPNACPSALTTLAYIGKTELKHKKAMDKKFKRVLVVQKKTSRALQQTINIVSDLSAQVVALKKRLEDLDAKNREISANINKQINTGESATVGEVNTCEDSTVSVLPTSFLAIDEIDDFVDDTDDSDDNDESLLNKLALKRRKPTVEQDGEVDDDEDDIHIIKQPKLE